LGFAVDRSLWYFTGGASWLDTSACGVALAVSSNCNVAGTTVSHTFDGWTIGGGYAYAFTNNFIGRIEYLYADYGTHAFATPGAAGGITNISVTTNKVRAGLSWKFGS
jgi:outer membrane immunogenic protein